MVRRMTSGSNWCPVNSPETKGTSDIGPPYQAVGEKLILLKTSGLSKSAVHPCLNISDSLSVRLRRQEFFSRIKVVILPPSQAAGEGFEGR